MARAVENNHAKPECQPGRDRLRMLGAVAHFFDLAIGKMTSLVGMDFACLSVSEACTACGVCGRACPTSALSFEKSDEGVTYTLNFSARKCIGCEICRRVCASEAISLNHEPTFAQVFHVETVALQNGELVRCERCRTPIAARPGVQLCPLCEYRRTHPFESSVPPAIKTGRLVGPGEKYS